MIMSDIYSFVLSLTIASTTSKPHYPTTSRSTTFTPIVWTSTNWFPAVSGPDFTHPLFTQITHLAVHEYAGSSWETWSGLAQMSYLTHLSFLDNVFTRDSDDTVYRNALMHCKSLQVLAMHCREEHMRQLTPHYRAVAFDPRFVIVSIKHPGTEWQIGARGGEDHWVRAERLVKKRRSGETKDYAIGL
ncbi:hypothetical protein C8R44DRAFT_989174 [Mycena epipterygia]|nr:hypothetical protein C8R44DRAFT_989174 [Mycena epipterygia]